MSANKLRPHITMPRPQPLHHWTQRQLHSHRCVLQHFMKEGGKKNRTPVCVSANVRRQIKRQTERICVSEVCLNLSRCHLILIQFHQRSRPTKTLTLSFSRPTRTEPHQRECGPDQSTWTRADKHSAQVFSLQTDGWNWSQQNDRPHICTGAWERTRGERRTFEKRRDLSECLSVSSESDLTSTHELIHSWVENLMLSFYFIYSILLF